MWTIVKNGKIDNTCIKYAKNNVRIFFHSGKTMHYLERFIDNCRELFIVFILECRELILTTFWFSECVTISVIIVDKGEGEQ